MVVGEKGLIVGWRGSDRFGAIHGGRGSRRVAHLVDVVVIVVVIIVRAIVLLRLRLLNGLGGRCGWPNVVIVLRMLRGDGAVVVVIGFAVRPSEYSADC